MLSVTEVIAALTDVEEEAQLIAKTNPSPVLTEGLGVDKEPLLHEAPHGRLTHVFCSMSIGLFGVDEYANGTKKLKNKMKPVSVHIAMLLLCFFIVFIAKVVEGVFTPPYTIHILVMV